MKKKLIALSLLLIVGGATALYLGGYLFSGEASASEESDDHVELDSHGQPINKSESLYLPLNPPFVVNFTHLGTLRYLQISLEIMYPEQELLDKVTENMPAIRNELIMLLSDQKFERLSSHSGKEEIRKEMIVAINQLILPSPDSEDAESLEHDENEEHAETIGEIFFTNYVMQ